MRVQNFGGQIRCIMGDVQVAYSGALTRANGAPWVRKFFLSMHPRKVGSHGPSAPQGNQYKMTFFTLCGACNLCLT